MKQAIAGNTGMRLSLGCLDEPGAGGLHVGWRSQYTECQLDRGPGVGVGFVELHRDFAHKCVDIRESIRDVRALVRPARTAHGGDSTRPRADVQSVHPGSFGCARIRLVQRVRSVNHRQPTAARLVAPRPLTHVLPRNRGSTWPRWVRGRREALVMITMKVTAVVVAGLALTALAIPSVGAARDMDPTLAKVLADPDRRAAAITSDIKARKGFHFDASRDRV